MNIWLRFVLAIFFWLLIWTLVSAIIGKEVLFASPRAVADKLILLMTDHLFYRDIFNSLAHVCIGFITAVVVACFFSILSLYVPISYDLLSPFFSFVKATPVASFILIAFLIFGSQRLSVLISFLMALPVLYGNLADGFRSVSKGELDAARVFNMSSTSRLRYIYLPHAVPFFLSGCSISLGLAWKAGVAAEVIGLARFSLGERLYNAKLFLDTAEVFATTIVIVVVSWITEKLAMKTMQLLCNKLL